MSLKNRTISDRMDVYEDNIKYLEDKIHEIESSGITITQQIYKIQKLIKKFTHTLFLNNEAHEIATHKKEDFSNNPEYQNTRQKLSILV